MIAPPRDEAGFADAIREASDSHRALRFRGGGSKDFYGERLEGEVLDTRGFSGLVEYDPTELVVSARCGTPLAELEALLGERGQMLAFEPPHFGAAATVGGMVAAGLSGPRRAAAGAVRDYVLGATVMDGQGRSLRFGGRVMKNVAGYDISRLMAGSLGTLALILEVSLKTLPRPAAESTRCLELSLEASLQALNGWSGRGLPVSASAWRDGKLHVRLSGTGSAVSSALGIVGGEDLEGEHADAFWKALRDQSGPFFRSNAPLWRVSLPASASADSLAGVSGEVLIEWGGALRWLRSDASAARIREAAAQAGGHAALFRCAGEVARRNVFHPLPSALMNLHRRLKQAFDPRGIFNPARMYPDF